MAASLGGMTTAKRKATPVRPRTRRPATPPGFATFFALAALAGSGCTRAVPPAPRLSPLDVSSPDARAVALPLPSAPGRYMGRVIAMPMGYDGADWLDRSDREVREQPEHVLDVLGIAPGSTVADVGAGTGYFTLRMARRVGPRGRVIATDLQPEMLAALNARAREAGLGNVTPILAEPSDARLPRGALDLVLMVDVYHELPDPRGTLLQIHDALKPDGRLALVEYRGEDPAVAIKPEHKMTLPQIRRELEASAFRFVRSDESLPDQRIVLFAR